MIDAVLTPLHHRDPADRFIIATVVIMRDNRPFAQIVPMQKRRTIKKLPALACKVDFADLCSDDSEMWDACNA